MYYFIINCFKARIIQYKYPLTDQLLYFNMINDSINGLSQSQPKQIIQTTILNKKHSNDQGLLSEEISLQHEFRSQTFQIWNQIKKIYMSQHHKDSEDFKLLERNSFAQLIYSTLQKINLCKVNQNELQVMDSFLEKKFQLEKKISKQEKYLVKVDPLQAFEFYKLALNNIQNDLLSLDKLGMQLFKYLEGYAPIWRLNSLHMKIQQLDQNQDYQTKNLILDQQKVLNLSINDLDILKNCKVPCLTLKCQDLFIETFDKISLEKLKELKLQISDKCFPIILSHLEIFNLSNLMFLTLNLSENKLNSIGPIESLLLATKNLFKLQIVDSSQIVFNLHFPKSFKHKIKCLKLNLSKSRLYQFFFDNQLFRQLKSLALLKQFDLNLSNISTLEQQDYDDLIDALSAFNYLRVLALDISHGNADCEFMFKFLHAIKDKKLFELRLNASFTPIESHSLHNLLFVVSEMRSLVCCKIILGGNLAQKQKDDLRKYCQQKFPNDSHQIIIL